LLHNLDDGLPVIQVGRFPLERSHVLVWRKDKTRWFWSGFVMKRLLKGLILVFLFLAGTAFRFSSHANRGHNLANPAAWKTNQTREIPSERERGMVRPISGEVRTKGLPMGLWGGEHISMEVTEQRTTVEYDCAHATIDQRIALDRRGRFNVSGIQAPEHGGPVRRNETPDGYPVRFSGQVNGKTMTLSVRNSATKHLVGTFTLVYGAEAKLRKCR
jgi:hypothetical protein